MSLFPRSVLSLHQIEMTSKCNLRCVYCPSPSIMAGKYPKRPPVDMTRETYERALEWVKFYVTTHGQNELNLAGIGESTIHPEFVDFVRLAREAVGSKVKLIFATNGIEHDEDMVKKIAPYAPEVYVSLHRPEKAGRAIEMYRKYGILGGVSVDPSVNANNWAGQVDWIENGGTMGCQWLRQGKIFCFADGRLSTCCFDAQGLGIIGHVNDEIGLVKTSAYDLCKTCNQTIGHPEWNQKEGRPV